MMWLGNSLSVAGTRMIADEWSIAAAVSRVAFVGEA